MATLRIDLPEGEVLHHFLQPGRTTIGRSSASDIVISDLSLSRRHAVIFSSGHQFFIEDAGSRNRTYVNHHEVRDPVGLSDGDVIKIGSTRIHFRIHSDPTPEHDLLESEIVTWTEAVSSSGEHPLTGSARYLISQQLDLAREIQRFLLPRSAPELCGYRIAGDTQPCHAVGGDFLDYHERRDGSLILVVADVARKGLGAALLGHYCQAYLRGAVGQDEPLEDLVARLNANLEAHSPPNQFLDAIFCHLHCESGEMDYVIAGHCKPLIIRADGATQWLKVSNMLVGILPEVVYTPGHARLNSGDMLILYTDGVTEFMNMRDEDFGEERLVAFMADRAGDAPEKIMRDLEARLEEFSEGRHSADDITLVIVQRL